MHLCETFMEENCSLLIKNKEKLNVPYVRVRNGCVSPRARPEAPRTRGTHNHSKPVIRYRASRIIWHPWGLEKVSYQPLVILSDVFPVYKSPFKDSKNCECHIIGCHIIRDALYNRTDLKLNFNLVWRVLIGTNKKVALRPLSNPNNAGRRSSTFRGRRASWVWAARRSWCSSSALSSPPSQSSSAAPSYSRSTSSLPSRTRHACKGHSFIYSGHQFCQFPIRRSRTRQRVEPRKFNKERVIIYSFWLPVLPISHLPKQNQAEGGTTY